MDFSYNDLMIVGFLIFLEGILSVDNALVIAILAKPLPPALRKKAITYGLVGAITFRIGAIFLATYLIQWQWVKFAGGAYLLWVGLSNLLKKTPEESKALAPQNFWKTVAVIELTDMAFALDSILAAVALTPKIHLIIVGGIIGLVMMRFAAGMFLKLLDRFPTFETTAYVLVVIIGVKITLEGFQFEQLNFHSPQSPAFWVFWGSMVGAILNGFRNPKNPEKA